MSKEPRKPFISIELSTAIRDALRHRHGAFLRPGERFEVRGESHGDAWGVEITFENADRSLHLPVEVAFLLTDNPGCKEDEARDVMLDFADYFFDAYFRGAREVTLPLDWASFPYGEYTVRARGWERNLKLEDAADKLLAGHPVDDVVASLGLSDRRYAKA